MALHWHEGIPARGRRYNASGGPLGNPFQVNTHNKNDQQHPSVAALPNGGFVVAWLSFGQDGALFGVYGQRYDATGARVGGEFRINTTKPDFASPDHNEPGPSVASFSNGGFVITWGMRNTIFAQRYIAAGARMGGEFQVNTSEGHQITPSVAALSGDAFVVIWRASLNDWGVHGQRYTAGGARAGGQLKVNTTHPYSVSGLSVAALNNGGFIVTWAARPSKLEDPIVYRQRYTAAGAPVGDQLRVNTTPDTTNATRPSVATLSDGDFVIVWGSPGVRGQRFSP